MRRRDIINELKIALMVTGIGMGIFASMLLFGMRAKACEIRDGVNTPIFTELVTMNRNEREDMRNAEDVLADEDGAEDVTVGYSASDLDLLAAIVYAEAGTEDFTGQRLVADVVLNRVHSPAWPNTVSEVVYQPYQFSPVLDGGLDRAWGNVTESCYEAARLALQGDHINTEVIYFSMYGCSNGIFAFQHGCHYFGY